MRTVLAAALCLALGACKEEPELYGIYDLVSVDGESLPTAGFAKGWFEIRLDGTTTLAYVTASSADTVVNPGTFLLGESQLGHLHIRSQDQGSEWTGIIRGQVLTIEDDGVVTIYHKGS